MGTLAGLCRTLVARWRNPNPAAPTLPDTPSHAPDGSLADHLLTTAALVACLAHDLPEREALRLAALLHDHPEWHMEASTWANEIAPWIERLRAHGRALDAGQYEPITTDDPAARALLLAHLAASARKPITTASEFGTHPLAGGGAVDLVYGGSTKVKEYVFESARLPEIRGASVLLDHVNRLDLPALWGVPPEETGDTVLNAAQAKRYNEAREWFRAEFGAEPLDCPECVLYASGGNLLALAPPGRGAQLAQAIERRYTHVTLVANSVAVAEPFTLLELQYGHRPAKGWSGEVRALWLEENDAQARAEGEDERRARVHERAEVQRLLRQNLGQSQPEPRGDAGAPGTVREAADALKAWDERKGFGELVTRLALRTDRRRAGGGEGLDAPRALPFVELIPHARKCSSCDVRPATQRLSVPNEIFFCEACGRKHRAGRWAKKERGQNPEYGWLQPWGTWLEGRMHTDPDLPTREVYETADDLADVADDNGFVGLIYADGNNVGARVAALQTISAYRAFARQMLEANEQAVASALATWLQPTAVQWPFEVLTIGGDDVLLFVPADRALDVALHIAERFEEKMGSEAEAEAVSLSVGVLLMADAVPVRFARDLTEQLLKSAKKRARPLVQQNKRDKTTASTATVDFMALKGVPMVTGRIEGFREEALWREEPGRKRLALTQRPYTLTELKGLVEAARALQRASFPRSQLYGLARDVEAGRLLRTAVNYAYFVQRGKRRRTETDNPFAKLDEQLQQLCGPRPEHGIASDQRWLPWREREGPRGGPNVPDFDTPLLDLIEIYPFVRPHPERSRDATPQPTEARS